MSDILEKLAKFSPVNTSEASSGLASAIIEARRRKQENAASSTNQTPPEITDPAAKLAQDVAQVRAANSNPNSLAVFNLSQERGNSLTSNNEVLQSWDTLTPNEFLSRYGKDVYDQVAASKVGAQGINSLTTATRTTGEQASDAAVGVLSGAAAGVADTSAFLNRMVPGFGNPVSAEISAKVSQGIRSFAEGLKSDALQRRKVADAFRGQLDTMDNQGLAEQDIAAGLDSFTGGALDIARGAASGAGRYIEDPAILGDATAQGVGSLAVGGPEAKLISKAGQGLNRAISNKIAGRSLNAVENTAEGIARAKSVQKALDQVAFPLAIGAMEGGAAANQTFEEVMGTDLEELKGRPEFDRLVSENYTPEEARRKLAFNASTVAGTIQAPVGALTGKIVEGFERVPFRGVGSLPANVAREFTEEAIQSGSGQLAQNIGEKTTGADPDQSLVEGIGEQAIQGGLAGAGTAGAIQGPGYALRATAKAAALPLKAAVNAASNRLEGRYKRIQDEVAAASPVSQETVAADVSEASADTENVAQAIQTMATDKNVDEGDVAGYIHQIQQNATVQEEDLNDLSPNLVEQVSSYANTVGAMPDRFQMMALMADMAGNEQLDQNDRIDAASFLLSQSEKQKSLFTEDLPEFLETVPQDSPEYQRFAAYAGVFSAIEQTPSIQKAIKWAINKMEMEDTDLSETDFQSPEGQHTVKRAVSVATYNPIGINEAAAGQILQHAVKGLEGITADQARIIRGATALLNSARVYEARMRLVEPETTKSVENGIDFVSREISSEGGSKGHQLSLKQHVSGIAQAIKAGDTKLASERVEHLAGFAQSMRNKLEAINKSIAAKEDGKKRGPSVPYEALDGNGKFYTNQTGIYFQSERLAKQVEAEALAAIALANDFINDYPEYGAGIINAPVLQLSGRDENINNNALADNSENRGDSTARKSDATSETQATTTGSKTVDAAKPQLESPRPLPEPTRATEKPTSVGEVTAKVATDPVEETNKAIEPAAPANRAGGLTVVKAETAGSTEEAGATSDLKSDVKQSTTLDLDLEDILKTLSADNADQDPENSLPTQYPDLIKSVGTNWFLKAFKTPREQASRIAKLSRPLQEILDMLASPQSLVAFMDGKDVNYNVTVEDRRDYHRLLKKGDLVLKQMKTRLKTVLKPIDPKAQQLLKELGQDTKEVLRYRDLRALNLLDRIDSSVRYNPQLIETAVLAGLDWALNAQDRSARLDKSDVAKLIGVPEDNVTEDQINDMNRGLSLSDAKRTLAQRITKFWNVSPNSGTAEAYTVGIPEAIASEVLHGLQAAGLIDFGTLSYPSTTKKEFSRVWFDTRKEEDQALVKSLDGVSNLIEDLMLIDPEKSGYAIGAPISDVDTHQLRDPSVPTTAQQKKALRNAQNAGHAPNLPMFDFVSAVGKEAFVSIHSQTEYREGDLVKDYKQLGMNRGHAASVTGKMRTWANSYDNVQKLMAKMEKHLAKQRKDPNSRGTLNDVRLYYKYSISSLGRMQMQGLSNIQADKHAREIFLATESVSDLSNENSQAFELFALAVAQGLDDIKVGKVSRDEVVKHVRKEAMTEGGKFRPLITMMKQWLNNRGSQVESQMPSGLKEELYRLNLPMHGWHGALELARYENMRENGGDLSRFKTSLYLEADGVTNGPINAMMLMFNGAFSADMLRLVAKGGVFMGRLNQTLNDYKKDTRDLYKEVADKTRRSVNEFVRSLEENADVHSQAMAFQRVLSKLNMKDVRLEENPDGSVNIVYERGLAKNPLTITVYASGLNGIAGNISDAMVSVIYEKMTDEANNREGLDAEFKKDLNALLTARPRKSKDNGEYSLDKRGNPAQFDNPAEFLLTPRQFNMLKANTRFFLVDQLGDAIHSTVMGHVEHTTTMIQQATQIQSVVMRGMFHNAVAKALAERKLNPEDYPEYREGDFLSKSELNEILRQVRPFGPLVQTGTQNYSIAGAERSDVLVRYETDKQGNEKQIPITYTAEDGRKVKVSMPESFSRSLTGDMRSPAFVYGPALSGVRMVPTMVIGSGDGQMMLNAISADAEMASRSGLVFDGFNMPLDKIEEYSEKMNKAVFDTWVENKAISSMSQSFSDFMALDPITQALSDTADNIYMKDTWQELTKILEGPNPEGLADLEAIQEFAKGLMEDLQSAASIKEAHKTVLKELPWSIDQMNSGGAPHVNTGSLEIPENATYGEMARIMNDRLEELTGENQTDIRPELISEDTAQIEESIQENSRKDVSGANEFTAEEFELMLKKHKLATLPVHKEMIRNAFKAIKGQGYRFVVGEPVQLDQWEHTYNEHRFVPGSNDGYGKIDPVAKVIFIRKRGIEKSIETVNHELVHAATLHKVVAFYENPKALSKEDQDAVSRIEGLMGDWISRDTSNDTGEFLDANHAAVTTIESYLLENGRVTEDPIRKAHALNEFMAWVLSNQHLIAVGKKEKVRNGLFRIVGEALQALKDLIWGGPNKGPRVGDSVLSNLRFNTRVLMATPTPVELIKQDANEVALHHSSSFGESARLTNIRERFNNKIVAYIHDNGLNPATKGNRFAKVNKALAEADDVAGGFAASFPGLHTAQAFSTFRSIVSAMMVDTDLNPIALTRIEELYAHVVKNLNVEDLQRDPDSQDQSDIKQAQDKLNTLNGLSISKTDEHGRSTLMSSFLALAMVDDSFREVLSKIDRPKSEKLTDGSMDSILENAGNEAMERLSFIMAGDNRDAKDVTEALDALTGSLVKKTGDQRLFIERELENGLDRLDHIVTENIERLTDKVIENADAVQNDPAASRTKKVASKIALIPAGILNKKISQKGTQDLVSWSNRTDKFRTARELAVEVIGRTADNAGVFDMISKVRQAVQQLRQQFREQLPKELESKFSRKLEDGEWTAMFKTLGKTDLASLYDRNGLSGALEFIGNPRRVKQEIKRLEDAIRAADGRRFTRLQSKSKQLAEYMITGRHGTNLLRNAKAVARLAGEGNMFVKSPDAALVGQIDRLVSLYALENLDQDTMDTILELSNNEREGLEFVFAFLNGLRNDELAKISGSTMEINHYKGFIPSDSTQNVSMVISDDTNYEDMILRGYTRVGSYSGSSVDSFGSKRSYYFTPNTGRATFNQGVMQTVHQTVAGIDPSTGFTLHEPTGGRITSDKAIARINRQLRNQAQTEENLLPVYDEDGKVLAYERGVNPAELTRLDRSTHLAEMMGVWQGRQMEEHLAQEFNNKLVDNLSEQYEKDIKAGRRNEYVNLARQKSDPVLAEAWRLVPNHTKAYIEEVFGQGSFWVRRDMLNDAVGFRQASIVDPFTGQSRWSDETQDKVRKAAIGVFGKNAYQILVTNEQRVQNVVTEAKLLIVVKSVIVPVANMTANMVQMVNRGVPIRNVLKGVGSKTSEINYYIKQRHREIALDVDLRAAKGRNDQVGVRKLTTELSSIQDAYRRLTIWPLIEAGEFSAISDGHITEEDLALSQGKWGEHIEKLADKMPAPIRNAYRYGMITRDTALFQGLARSVQYGDFVAKAVLYDDLVQRQKVKKEDAIASVNEAFVNYNRLAGRTRNYAESVGLTWFWHFKLRSMKEAAWMIRNRPLRTLLLIGVPGITGMGTVDSPVTDNWLSSFINGKLGYSIGPWMGMNSFTLNPWVNLVR